jgi:hypothetical protein
MRIIFKKLFFLHWLLTNIVVVGNLSRLLLWSDVYELLLGQTIWMHLLSRDTMQTELKLIIYKHKLKLS